MCEREVITSIRKGPEVRENKTSETNNNEVAPLIIKGHLRMEACKQKEIKQREKRRQRWSHSNDDKGQWCLKRKRNVLNGIQVCDGGHMSGKRK